MRDVAWLQALLTSVERLRPPHYSELPYQAQRTVDSVLSASMVVGGCVCVLVPIYAYFGSGLALLLMAALSTQPLLSIALLRRGHHTGALVVLTLWIVLVLDAIVLTSGGAQSTANRWFVVVAPLTVLLLPARARVPAIAMFLAHHLALLWLMHAGRYVEMPYTNGSGLVIDSLVTVVAATALGRSVALTRRTLLKRLARTENDLTMAARFALTGFFAVDRQGRLSADPSAPVKEWLGGGQRRDSAYACLKRRHPALAERFREGFAKLAREEEPADSWPDALPSETTVGGRHFRFRYRLWRESPDAPWSQLVATIEDVTENAQRELEAVRTQVMAVFIRMMHQDRQRAAERFSYVAGLFARVVHEPDSEQVCAWANELHELAREDELHAVASVLDDVRRAPDADARRAAIERLAEIWEEIGIVVKDLWQAKQQIKARASRTDYQTLLALIANEAPRDTIRNHIANWTLEQPTELLRHA